MLVHKHPARTAFFPNTGVPEIQFNRLSLFCFFRQMHRHSRPGDQAAAGHSQIFSRRQFDTRRVIQNRPLDAVVIFLPAMIRKRRHIIKNESVVLGVELRRSVRRSRAPSLAIAVYELAKSGILRSPLLRPGPNECQQCTGYRHRYIEQPAPSLGIFADHRFSHSVSPRNPGTRVCRGVSQSLPHTLLRFRPFCKRSYSLLFTSPGWDQLIFGPLLPLSLPPFAGKSRLLAESSMHTFGRNSILTLRRGNRPSGGPHGGTTNIPAKLEIDRGCNPPRPRIPYSFRESERGHRANYQRRRHLAGAGPGNTAGARPGDIACPAGLRF